MRTFDVNLSNIKSIKIPDQKLAICLGNFDGVHIAHQKLISNAVINSEFPVSVMSFSMPLGSLNISNKSAECLTSKTQKEVLNNQSTPTSVPFSTCTNLKAKSISFILALSVILSPSVKDI